LIQAKREEARKEKKLTEEDPSLSSLTGSFTEADHVSPMKDEGEVKGNSPSSSDIDKPSSPIDLETPILLVSSGGKEDQELSENIKKDIEIIK
jgi:hypothetical protein